ncbi:hypothetical protein HHO41_17710 [Bacillus sp. DNRA2]|nr:hypothetical protein [Bacillus sp. DNRA2]NMD72114.1 hypothetical protein [Bacillus sp. DNRA2]
MALWLPFCLIFGGAGTIRGLSLPVGRFLLGVGHHSGAIVTGWAIFAG